jgi:hypothetical protein
MVEVTFILDATGTRLPLTAVKNIANPVPPAGTGVAYIVGAPMQANADALGNWTPNKISMYDDGATDGDATAGDNFWTFKVLAVPGEHISYKYTIGNADQTTPQSWNPTEEYPLTNRGLDVTDHNGDRKMVIHDVFADRPDPSDTKASMTVISND